MGFGFWSISKALRCKQLLRDLENQDCVYSVDYLSRYDANKFPQDHHVLVSGVLAQAREPEKSLEKTNKRLYKSLGNVDERKNKLIQVIAEERQGKEFSYSLMNVHQLKDCVLFDERSSKKLIIPKQATEHSSDFIYGLKNKRKSIVNDIHMNDQLIKQYKITMGVHMKNLKKFQSNTDSGSSDDKASSDSDA